MCSNILLLLAVYCVVVSGVKVDVHVKDVSPGYTTLEFRDAGKKIKQFTLSPQATDAGNIQVKTGGKIEETGLELEFVPKVAAILPVTGHSAIDVNTESFCSAGEICYEILGKTYFLHVEGVKEQHDTMKCPLSSEPNGIYQLFNLVPVGDHIPVIEGTIHELALKIVEKPQKCEIKAVAPGSVKPSDIVIPFGCTDNTRCLKENVATIKLHVTGVRKSQKKIVFTGSSTAVPQEFTLEVGGTTDDKIINVTKEGVIVEEKLPLTLIPTACMVKEVTGLASIPLVESAECEAGSQNCFKNKDSATSPPIAPTPTPTTTSTPTPTTTAPDTAASDNAFRLSLFFICAILGYML